MKTYFVKASGPYHIGAKSIFCKENMKHESLYEAYQLWKVHQITTSGRR